MISREEMLDIANLSKLYLTEDEIESAIKEMDGMINFINQINELSDEFDEVSNMDGIYNAIREDMVVDSLPQSRILENAQGKEDGFFYIKKFA